MAKIQKIELNLGQKNANPFKTARKSDTNPFRYSNFEGNTLQFADVFEGFDSKEISFKGGKHKLITSSVIGSITKLRNSITEPIVNFVNRVKEGISSAWSYAKNTNVEIAGLKNISDGIHNASENIYEILNYDIGKGISEHLSGIGKNLSEHLSFLNKDVTEIGHDLSGRWSALVGKIQHERITPNMSVEELRGLWIKQIESADQGAKEVALNPAHNMEEKVA